MKTDEIRQKITNQIVESLRKGGTPFWRRPWNDDPNCGAPANIVSHKQYRGINVLALMVSSLTQGFTSCFWATYRQWQAKGGQVRKGAKGTVAIYYKVLEKRVTKDDGGTKIERHMLLRYYTLFNLDQVDGEALDKYRPGHGVTAEAVAFPDWTKRADEVIVSTKADIRYGGNRAFFSPSDDFIQIPARQQFPDVRDFYDTHWHELSHWSCPRLDIKGGSYAFDELVAELSAAFISWQLGIPQSEDLTNHQAYLATWLKAMDNDPKWIFQAAAAASKSADYLLGFSQRVEAEPQVDTAEAA
jgi:antirestriction protein ArdC